MLKPIIGAITNPVAQTSWHAMRALWGWLDSSRQNIRGLKRSVKEIQASVKSYFKNATNTSHAVAEWSQDIAKLVWWLPYKVRMLPASSWDKTILSKKWDAIYLSEQSLNSTDFQQELKKAIDWQGIQIADISKLRVSMDYFWRLQFSYPGKFNNQKVFLDQFGEWTPTHTALTNAISWFIQTENKKICAKIALWHILKDNISKNNWFIRWVVDGEKESLSLDNAMHIILWEENVTESQRNILDQLLQEQDSSIHEIRDLIDTENISPKDIISQYPSWRKIMDKAVYLHHNNYYSFDNVTNTKSSTAPNQTAPTTSDNNNIDTSPSSSVTQQSNQENNINSSDVVKNFVKLEEITTPEQAQEKLKFVDNFIKYAPELAVKDIQLYAELITLKTQLESIATKPLSLST